ncbi:MAG: DNA (cytosine-5-)-methyltransferase [Leeuwenhoekiella sp.]
MKTAIDFYSGIGGWTLGMKLSGIENVASYEWWSEANQTHNVNFGTSHKEIDIRKIEVKDLKFDRKIDFIVGSPPCTQFSYANRGGNGDIQDGLIDVFKFLEIVDFLKPKYWAMENVPRVASIIEREIEGDGALARFKHLVKVITIVDSSEYGVPQKRKRMIAGNFPIGLFSEYKKTIPTVTLGDVLNSLKGDKVTDINFGYTLSRSEITELENEVDLTPQEERINKDSKTFHPIYNKMSFPDKLDRSSRTVTATCTRVSRESIIVESETGYRRLNVRERGVIQGFPLTYQFYGRTLNNKFKMIGNAVPPILTYYIFQAMLEIQPDAVVSPKYGTYFHEKPKFSTYKSELGLPKRKYSAKRKFKFAVPNLRYGSGVRFELSNNPKVDEIPWSFKFYHGNSKNIKEVTLDKDIKAFLAPIVNTTKNEFVTDYVDKIVENYNDFSSDKLQELWISKQSDTEIFDFLDDIGEYVETIIERADYSSLPNNLLPVITGEENRKLESNEHSILTGIYLLSSLNQKFFDI